MGRSTLANKKYQAPTIDRLVSWIEDEIARQGFHWGAQALERAKYTQKVEDKIRDAKIATVAIFLEQEAAAWQTGLPKYRDFLKVIFEGNRDAGALTATADSVLSFNYDRLFEMAFTDHFKLDARTDCHAKNWLNTGLSFLHNEASDFAPDQFCFLKLHGTAAMQVVQQYGQTRYGMNALRRAEWITDDNFFWPANAKPSSVPPDNPEPLIVFPHEKERAREGRTAFLYDKYIRATWDQAAKMVEEAEQIWIIGYSFDPTDRKSIFELLRKNKSDCDIVVQNPEAEKICNELKFRYSDLASRLKHLSNPF